MVNGNPGKRNDKISKLQKKLQQPNTAKQQMGGKENKKCLKPTYKSGHRYECFSRVQL
jgi:hypothetical protein